MGFNRSQRRKLEQRYRKSDTLDMVKGYVKRRIGDEVMDKIDNARIEMIMNCVVIALNNEFGFGQKRCMRVLKAIDALMVDIDNGKTDLEKLRAIAEEKANIQVCYEDEQIGRVKAW